MMRTRAVVDANELTSAIHVWYLCPEEQPAALEAEYLAWLAPAERAHYGKPTKPDMRREYLATRALCRATLSFYAGVHPSAWTFATGDHGKPEVDGPAEFAAGAGAAPLRFNLTHTRGLVACAVTRAGEVGLDAEDTTGTVDAVQVARHFYSLEEQKALAALPPDRQAGWFYKQWVLKEAYLKGRGTGLSEPPEGFTVERGQGGEPLPLGAWQLSLHRPTPRHVAAVAVRVPGERRPVPVRWFEAEEL